MFHFPAQCDTSRRGTVDVYDSESAFTAECSICTYAGRKQLVRQLFFKIRRYVISARMLKLNFLYAMSLFRPVYFFFVNKICCKMKRLQIVN